MLNTKTRKINRNRNVVVNVYIGEKKTSTEEDSKESPEKEHSEETPEEEHSKETSEEEHLKEEYLEEEHSEEDTTEEDTPEQHTSEDEYNYIYDMDDDIVNHISLNFEDHIKPHEIKRMNETRTIYSFQISLLMNLIRCKKIEFSEWNRLINPDNIERFESIFDPSESTNIILAFRRDTKKIEILDGQHRLTFLINKYQYYGRHIGVDVRICNNDLDYRMKLENIRSMNFDISQLTSTKINEVKRLFFVKYPEATRSFYGNHRPKLNKDKIFDMLKNNRYFLSTSTSGTKVFTRIIEINTFLKDCLDRFKDPGYIYLGSREEKTKVDMWMKESRKNNMYLQLDGSHFHVLNLLLDIEPGENHINWTNALNDAHMKKKDRTKRTFNYSF